MSFLIDTDICSAQLRGVAQVSSRMIQYGGRLHISVVSLGELKTWLYRKNTPPRYVAGLTMLMRDFTLLPVDGAIAEVHGQLGASLSEAGVSIATPDLQIAATAIVHGLTLVTHNARHFARVPGLSLADWLAP